MRIRTLGELALEGASLTRPKPLLLVAYLAIEGAQERRYVAELFWPAAVDPLKSLTVALSQLRRGAPGAVEADRQRLWTRLPCDAVELLERLERGEHEEALRRDRGAFLGGVHLPNVGVELEEWIFGTREVVAARTHQARLDRAERAAGEGRFQDGAQQAEGAIGLLSMAVEPQDLVRLHTLLLAGGSPLAARARDEVEGYGIELAGTSEAARQRLALARTAAGGAGLALPRRSTGFVGRDLELTEIGTLLTEGGAGLVTLVGPAGVGKTRLALQVAHEQQRLGAFPGGIHFVPLAALRSVSAIPGAIVEALGPPPDPSLHPLDQAARAIGEREVLLVCDGLEHLMEGVARLGALTAVCPGLRILLTSRERVNVEYERVFEVAGLGYPQSLDDEPEAVLHTDAVRLFLQRAGRARPGFAPADGELRHVVRICRLVEGLPLGLELAASWVRVMSVAEIADAIEHDIGILASSARDAPEHHRSVLAAFERSWALLGEHERRVMRVLAVCRGGFRREAAGAIAGATIATLASLVDKSLLRSAPDARFTRHTLLYQFTQQKLNEDPDEAAEAATRHASYYLTLLRDARTALQGGDGLPARQKAALDAIEAEYENIRAASAHQDPFADPVAHGEATEVLSTFFEARSRLREGVAFFAERVRQLPPIPAPRAPVRAQLHVAQARLLRCLGEHTEAISVAQAALDEFRAAGDAPGARSALQVLGVTQLHLGDYRQAAAHLERAAALVRAGDPAGERGSALANLALALQLSGERVAALEHLYQARTAFRQQGDGLREARLLNNLGLLHFEAGELEPARRVWEQGLALAQRLDNRRDALSLTANLGMLCAATGDYRSAREHDEHAMRVARAIGDKTGEAAAFGRQALVDLALGQAEQAEDAARYAIDLAWRVNETPRVLEYLKVLADVRAQRGDASQALVLYDLVHQHGAATKTVRDQAREGFGWLARGQPEPTVAAARERARATGLEALVMRAAGVATP